MKIGSFIKLVEIRTKVASVIPFFLGLAYTLYKFGNINILNTIVMFVAMVFLDMTVTAANNYFDYKRAQKREGYNYDVHNAIVQYDLKGSTVLVTILTMFIVSIALGIYLVYLTDYIILILGIACFGIGIIYSYGPLPLSRTPFGEIFSGGIMGFLIPFITIYINATDYEIIAISLKGSILGGQLDLMIVIGIIILSIPAVFCIANIMLANNICDIEDDFENKRYTLPILIGKKRALILLKSLFYGSFAVIVIGVIAKILPIYSLLVLLTFIPVQKNIRLFVENPTKKDTFGLMVKNFVTINASLVLTILIGAIINIIFN